MMINPFEKYREIMLRKQQEIENSKQQEYHNLTVRYIRERYSENDEFAILRQRASDPQEFEDYNAYCEACKIKAKEIVYRGNDSD